MRTLILMIVVLAGCTADEKPSTVTNTVTVPVTDVTTVTNTVTTTITETVTETVPADDPCINPIVTVLNDGQPLTVVRGGEKEIFGMFLSIGAVHATLTDASFDILTDDTVGDQVYDQVPIADDRISSCTLVNENNILLAGPEPVVGNRVEFHNFVLEISENASSEARVTCDFAPTSVENADDDKYAAFVANASDLSFEDAFGTALTNDDVCMPFGLPNAGGSYGATVKDNGELIVAPNGPPAADIYAGQLDVLMLDLWMTNLYEDMELSKIMIELQGDVSVVQMVHLDYPTLGGTTRRLSIIPDGDEAIFLPTDMALTESGTSQYVGVLIDVSPTAQPGDEITAVYRSEWTAVVGLDSNAIIQLDSIIPTADITGSPQTVL